MNQNGLVFVAFVMACFWLLAEKLGAGEKTLRVIGLGAWIPLCIWIAWYVFKSVMGALGQNGPFVAP